MTGICEESLNCGLIPENLCCGECHKLTSCKWVCDFLQGVFIEVSHTECKDLADIPSNSSKEGISCLGG